MYGIRVDIYEGAKKKTLVLTHVFWGTDRKGAVGILKAHMKTDEFLRAALTTGNWSGITLNAYSSERLV